MKIQASVLVRCVTNVTKTITQNSLQARLSCVIHRDYFSLASSKESVNNSV